MKNKFFHGFIVAMLIVTLVGCASIFSKNQGVNGKASKAEDKAEAKITQVDDRVATVNVERLDKIGAFSAGVTYSLQQDTNQSPAVTTALSLNQRVISLANKPDFKEAQEIANIVDQMITNQVEGAKMLAKKDSEIEALGVALKTLEKDKVKAVNAFIELANKNAALQDQYKATLGQMDSFLGLGAVFYGLKKFIISSLWILGIGGVLFIVLRIASMSNPIAAGLFSIFNVIGSWFIHVIQFIVPKAVSLAGNVSTSMFNAYKSTLTKVVDSIQMAKNNAAISGKPISIEDVLNEAAKTMNTDEKAIVDELKKALNWK